MKKRKKKKKKKKKTKKKARFAFTGFLMTVFDECRQIVATLFVATRMRSRGREGGEAEAGGKGDGERKTHHRTRASSSSSSSSSSRSKKTKGSSVVKNTTGKRPLQVTHLDTDADRNAVRIASKTPAMPVKRKEYAFDAVFDAQSTNEQVYRNVFLRSGKSSEDANAVETIYGAASRRCSRTARPDRGRLTR